MITIKHKKNTKQTIIPRAILRNGFEKCIHNGFSLVISAMAIIESNSHVALGLSQLAQEEIGKSLSILAAFRLKKDQWKWFWNAWLDHNMKSHRAFLYELISPCRLELKSKTGECLRGLPMRNSIPHEKEASFYVNYDAVQHLFTLPEEHVTKDEIANRTATAAYLAQKAFSIYSALELSEAEFRYESFSEIALRICSENLYQHEMPAILEEFSSRSGRHAALIEDLAKEMSKEKQFWHETITKPNQVLDE